MIIDQYCYCEGCQSVMVLSDAHKKKGATIYCSCREGAMCILPVHSEVNIMLNVLRLMEVCTDMVRGMRRTEHGDAGKDSGSGDEADSVEGEEEASPGTDEEGDIGRGPS